MRRKIISRLWVLLILAGVGMILPSTAAAAKEKAAAAVKAPIITLERVEIAHYWPFFLDTKEKRGSVMNLAFVFNIENPNKSSIKLEDMKFTVNFEPGFDIVTVTTNENFYIPGKTTNQVRVYATFDAFTALGNLMLIGGSKLQEMKVTAPDQLKSWWDGIQDFKFKIMVTEGTATFIAGKETVLSSFEAQFPK